MIPIRDGQKLALILLSKKCGVRSRDERLFLVSQLLGREVDTFNDLTLDDWRRIRNDAYPNWPADNWDIGQSFKQQVVSILREYREQVLGQMALFNAVTTTQEE